MSDTNSDPRHPYDERYYRVGFDKPYERSEEWVAFFSHIAERATRDFSPQTALDAGCAIGMLVEQLRARGVDARGFDISEYAIAQAPDALKPFVSVGSVLDPNAVSGTFDLLFCIEVLEHLRPEDADAAVANLCRWSSRILFSSSPDCFDEVTHLNVQLPGYWTGKFARHGFVRALDYDASYISINAMLFLRATPDWIGVVSAYENQLHQRMRENRSLRELAIRLDRSNAQQREDFESWEHEAANLLAQLHALEAENARLAQEKAALDRAQHEWESERATIITRDGVQIGRLRQQLKRDRQTLAQTRRQLEDEITRRLAAARDYESEILELRRPPAPPPAVEPERPAPPPETRTAGRAEKWAILAREPARLVKVSFDIIRRDGLLAFADNLNRWLHGQRRYWRYPVTTALPEPVAETIQETRRAPTPDDFRVLYVSPSGIATVRYRVDNAVEQLRERGITADSIEEFSFETHSEIYLNYDVIVFMRVRGTPTILAAAQEARRRGIATIYDIDDYLFDLAVLPYIDHLKDMSKHQFRIFAEWVDSARQLLVACDYFTGSTGYLVERARELGRPGFCLRNGLNARQIALAEEVMQRREQIRTKDNFVRIGYQSGSPTHRKDFAEVLPVLTRLLREFPHVILVVRGHLDAPDELKAFSGNVEFHPFVPWEALIEATVHLDIVIAPLERHNPFNEAKSALKYFEAALVETPIVATPTGDFREAIRHGWNGMLAETPDDWYACLRRLIVDADLRRQMGKNARRAVLAQFSPQVQGDRRLAVLRHILFKTSLPDGEPDALPEADAPPLPDDVQPVPDEETLAPPLAVMIDVTDAGERVLADCTSGVLAAHLALYVFAGRFVQGKRVLDAGCGTGYGAYLFSQLGASFVDAVDYSEKAIAFCNERYHAANLAFRVADLHQLAPPPRSIDFAFSSNVLEHLRDVDSFLEALCAGLTANGQFFMAVPPVLTPDQLAENLANPYHISNLHPRHWQTKLARYFEEVTVYRQRLSDEQANAREIHLVTSPYNQARDFTLSPATIEELERGAPTATLPLLAAKPRPTPLPRTAEVSGYPAGWDADLVRRALERLYGA